MVTPGAIAPAINGKYHITRYGEMNHVAPSPAADTTPIDPEPVERNGHLRVPIDSILPDPDNRGQPINEKPLEDVRKKSDPLGAQPVGVRPVIGRAGSYRIVIGERRWRLARAAGQAEIEVTLLENLSEQEIGELQLSEYYHHENLPPMAMGRAFLRHRERFNVPQQELARRTGITPGTIHHYESLVKSLAPDLAEKVERGLLTFKEGRSIADITDHERQREIAGPFLSGKLSSVYVERVVMYAKHRPTMPVDDVLRDVLAGTKAAAKIKKSNPEAPRAGVDIAKLESAVLDVAGTLDAVQLQQVPEYRRLKLISTLRILEAKTRGALGFLSTGQAQPLRAVV